MYMCCTCISMGVRRKKKKLTAEVSGKKIPEGLSLIMGLLKGTSSICKAGGHGNQKTGENGTGLFSLGPTAPEPRDLRVGRETERERGCGSAAVVEVTSTFAHQMREKAPQRQSAAVRGISRTWSACHLVELDYLIGERFIC